MTGGEQGNRPWGCRAARCTGHDVLIGARDPRRGEEAAAALRAAGGDAHALTLDVTDPATVQEAAQQIKERIGYLDLLINNAGIRGSAKVSPEHAYDQIPSSVDLDMVRAVFETETDLADRQDLTEGWLGPGHRASMVRSGRPDRQFPGCGRCRRRSAPVLDRRSSAR